MAFPVRICVVLLLYLRLTFAQTLTLSFDLPQSFSPSQYFAYTGTTVYLTCTLPSTRANPPTILKGFSLDGLVIVEDGKLREDLSAGKYALTHRDDLSYTLEISDLATSDSDFYACASEEELVWFYTDILVEVVHLFVEDQPILPEPMCVLDGVTAGVYFVGEDVKIVCLVPDKGPVPTDGDESEQEEAVDFFFQVISKDRVVDELEYRDEVILESGDNRNVHFHKQTYVISEIGLEDDETSFYCSYSGSASTNYCGLISSLDVYEKLVVGLKPEMKTVQNGDSVVFTCNSVPDMLTNVDWTLSSNGYAVDSVRTWQTADGAMLSVNNIQFSSMGGGEIRISCHVTVGSTSATQDAFCLQGDEDGGLLFTTESNENEGPSSMLSDNPCVKLLVILLIVGALFLSIATVAVIVYARHRLKSQSPAGSLALTTNESDENNLTSKGEKDIVKSDMNILYTSPRDDVEYSYIENGLSIRDTSSDTATKEDRTPYSQIDHSNDNLSGGAQVNAVDVLDLGLSNEGSEVIINTIYEPYDE